MAKLIEAVDVVTNFYTYEGIVKALNKVSLVVDSGSSFGLVGESGCGKSVMVRSMMRIVSEPGVIEDGKILVFFNEKDQAEAVDLLQQSEVYMEGLRGNQISMIFQEPNAALNPIMSIGDQVAESFLFHRRREMSEKILKDLHSAECRMIYPLKIFLQFAYGLCFKNPDALLLKLFSKIPVLNLWRRPLRREALARSIDIIGKLSIPNPEKVVNQYPHNLSGGMKQRIVIAIALACHPLLLIADEATSNLDVTIQAQILELIKELKKTEIASILYITHDLGIVAETCDRVGVMYAGNICEVADLKDLFQKPRHPYTKALLDAVPKFAQEGQLKSIEGAVPNLVTPPAGCRFHPRCKQAKEICKQEMPQAMEVEKNHWVMCHWNGSA
jgi:peptide/nickel transport system ATP-binding protein